MRPGTASLLLAFHRRGSMVVPSALLGFAGLARGPGDRGEWADVVARYADVVYNIAYRLTGDDEEARDLAQDVLLRLHKGLDRYREGNFEGWLYRTTVNAFR